MRRTAVRLASEVLTVMLGVILTLIIVTLLARQPGHDDIYARLEVMEHQLQYVSCILLIPPADRLPDNVAACQLDPVDP